MVSGSSGSTLARDHHRPEEKRREKVPRRDLHKTFPSEVDRDDEEVAAATSRRRVTPNVAHRKKDEHIYEGPAHALHLFHLGTLFE